MTNLTATPIPSIPVAAPASSPNPSSITSTLNPADILALRVGGARTIVRVTAIEQPSANSRLVIYTEGTHGNKYKVSEVWERDHTGAVTFRSLYLQYDSTGAGILSTSHLANLLAFYKVQSLGELIGKEIAVEPKRNGFMAIVAYA